MFNLIMTSFDWPTNRESLPISRLFEYTDLHITNEFKINNQPNLDLMSKLPCLFMNEGVGSEVAYVGQIIRPRIMGTEVSFEFALDNEVPPLLNSTIFANKNELSMTHDFEFHRNHWAIKDMDLYRFLLRNVRPRRQRPNVFNIAEHEGIEPTLVSVMMPFAAEFGAVFESIKQASDSVGLRCRRADDIWENAAIIQDVVSLIDRSRIVICDCTGRNPNVFYEAGIAHTLGREVILIAQSEQDIPFDLRHLRYIRYHNNSEGLSTLGQALYNKMRTILGN